MKYALTILLLAVCGCVTKQTSVPAPAAQLHSKASSLEVETRAISSSVSSPQNIIRMPSLRAATMTNKDVLFQGSLSPFGPWTNIGQVSYAVAVSSDFASPPAAAPHFVRVKLVDPTNGTNNLAVSPNMQ